MVYIILQYAEIKIIKLIIESLTIDSTKQYDNVTRQLERWIYHTLCIVYVNYSNLCIVCAKDPTLLKLKYHGYILALKMFF